MNLLVIWLIISIISTIIVLLCIRSAPYIDDEPLNSELFGNGDEPKRRIDSRHDEGPHQHRSTTRDGGTAFRDSRSAGSQAAESQPKRSSLMSLGNLSFMRSKETQS